MFATDSPRMRVCIVMTTRERHALTESALASIVAHTPKPYRLMFLDTGAPDWLRTRLEQRAPEWGLERVQCAQGVWPQQARAQLAPSLDCDYAVFIDNDVEVYPGWLQALLDCAEATGAGVIGPLYLWNDGAAAPRIHMAGGQLTPLETAQGPSLGEAHRRINEDPEVVAPLLRREACGYMEFHCMMVRGALFRAGVLDPAIRCVHEHIDVSLSAERLGYRTYFEPTSRVNYRAFEPFRMADLPVFRWRWNPAEGEASIAAFCRKWGYVDDPRAFGGVRDFLRVHLATVDPLRDAHAVRADRDAVMTQAELCQNRSELLELAQTRGYDSAQVALLSDACRVAQVLMDGGYRPCGRPFINHLIGTASVLLRYDYRIELVAAGLLHAAYTHSPPHPGGTRAAADTITAWLGGPQSAIEQRVRAYTLRGGEARYADLDEAGIGMLSVHEGEVLVLAAANDIDMLLSGEVRYSGRNDTLSPALRAAVTRVCALFDTPGLALTLEQLALAQAQASVAPASLLSGFQVSYRISPDKRGAVPMVSDVPRLLADTHAA
jgi:hypothetical protein